MSEKGCCGQKTGTNGTGKQRALAATSRSRRKLPGETWHRGATTRVIYSVVTLLIVNLVVLVEGKGRWK